jgi:hypothetical protein
MVRHGPIANVETPPGRLGNAKPDEACGLPSSCCDFRVIDVAYFSISALFQPPREGVQPLQ